MKKRHMLLLIAAVLIMCCNAIVKDDIPVVAEGKAVVFYEPLSSGATIIDVDATDDYIFYAYGRDGVVEAYNWDGEYQFSVAVYDGANGACAIGCDQDLLYVLDKDKNVFVFRGESLLRAIEIGDSPYPIVWFDGSSGKVRQYQNELVDENGIYIMDLPGKGIEKANIRMLFTCVLMALLFVLSFSRTICRQGNGRTGDGLREPF